MTITKIGEITASETGLTRLQTGHTHLHMVTSYLGEFSLTVMIVWCPCHGICWSNAPAWGACERGTSQNVGERRNFSSLSHAVKDVPLPGT